MAAAFRISDRDADEIGEAIREGHRENFEQQRSGSGDGFAPLAPSTVAERIRLGYGGTGPILIRTGEYARSFIDAAHADHISRLARGDLEFSLTEGSDDYRVLWLEYGAENIPARPVRELSPEAAEHVLDVVESIIMRNLRDDG